MRCRHLVVFRKAVVLGCLVVSGGAGMTACGWKVPESVAPGAAGRATLVVMQNQDGEILGSKVIAPAAHITVSTADAQGVPLLSSRYIAVRSEPKQGNIGDLIAASNTGSVSFVPPVNGAPVRAVFMNTADVPESVMDCYYGNFLGTGFRRVSRTPPGGYSPTEVTVLDGDESIFTGAIDDLNRALVDRQGVVLGRLSWDRNAQSPDIMAGFSEPALVVLSWDWLYEVWYVFVNPRDPPGNQTLAAVSGFLCGDSCYQNPCGRSVADYLLDPAAGYRLSRRGASLLRLGAYFNSNREGGW